MFDWLDLPQADIKAIRVALGKPKMNDLVLAIIAGGLRRYLLAKDELPERSLVAMCPINVRGSGDPLEGGNQVAAMRVAIGTDIDDPVKRLAAIAAATRVGKAQAELRIGVGTEPRLPSTQVVGSIATLVLKGAPIGTDRGPF